VAVKKVTKKSSTKRSGGTATKKVPADSKISAAKRSSVESIDSELKKYHHTPEIYEAVKGLRLVGFIAVSSAQRRMEAHPILAGDDGTRAMERLAHRMTVMNPGKDWAAYTVTLGDDNDLVVGEITVKEFFSDA